MTKSFYCYSNSPVNYTSNSSTKKEEPEKEENILDWRDLTSCEPQLKDIVAKWNKRV